MKILCINNTGAALRPYEYESITQKEIFGRFDSSAMTEYDVTIGKEYSVMGIVIFQCYQAFLIDENGLISASPCPLFEIIDNKLSSNWHFRFIKKEESIYPFVQAIFGYSEFCLNEKAYESLIVDRQEEACQVYFRRKIELEKELSQ